MASMIKASNPLRWCSTGILARTLRQRWIRHRRRSEPARLVLTALMRPHAVDFDSAASGPRASPSRASMSRSDRPRTHAEITSASNGADRTTPLPSSANDSHLSGLQLASCWENLFRKLLHYF